MRACGWSAHPAKIARTGDGSFVASVGSARAESPGVADQEFPVRERALYRVRPYLRPHTKRIVFIAGSAVASIGAQLAIPLIVAAAIDGPIADGGKASIVTL